MFKIGDKVVLTNGEKWVNKCKYKKIVSVVAEGVYILTRDEECGEGGAFWYDRELELYVEEVESVFKNGDKVVLKSGERWSSGARYRVVKGEQDGMYSLSLNEVDGRKASCVWYANELDLYKEEIETEMKELTFKEVIANIREGETWESAFKTVSMSDKDIFIKRLNGEEFAGDVIGFANCITFKKQSAKVNFEEALKGYEEGKAIKSLESGTTYKANGEIGHSLNVREFEGLEDFGMFGREIQGEWLILG